MQAQRLDHPQNSRELRVALRAERTVQAFELPDDIARQMIPAGHDPSRTALEDMAAEAYRAHRLTEHQLATLLGLGRYELDGFLKQREVWLEYTMDDLQQELEVGERLWNKREEELGTLRK